MAQGYDSDVQLSVGLSLEDVKSQCQKLTSEVSKIFNSVDSSKLDSKMRKLQSTMSKTESQMESIYQKIADLEQKAADTANYSELQQRVEAGRAEIERLVQELEKAQQAGDDFNVNKISSEIENLTHDVQMFDDSMTQMLDSGFTPFTEEDNTRLAEYKNKLGDLNNQQRLNIEAFNQMRDKASGLSIDFGKLASSVAKVVNIGARLVGLGPIIDGVKNKVSGLISKFNSASASSNNFGKAIQTGLKKLMSYGLGIASLTSLFNKMRSAITSGIQTMAKMNNGLNTTNAAMTQFTSMLNLVKGSLASAFAPILTYVTPMLSSFMQQLANVITMVGMFIAKLTGAKSYMKATFKSTDYAKSLSKGGGGKSAQQKYEEAVKKAQEKYDKQVAKINEQNANAEAKAAEKNAKAEEKQAKAADKLAKSQEKANNKLAAFDDLNVLGVDDTEDAVDELEQYEAALKELPELELPDLEDFLGGGGGGGGEPFGLEEIPLDDWEFNWDDLLAKARELGEKFAEFLNDIFKDEDLAKKIGDAIGNLINMAINFAYGFVSKFDFYQFGRWLGTLLQEAIETIDWGLLGDTIAIGLNGIADAIIGFFKTYNVGTLGKSISEMLNNAIHEVDEDKIGEATLDVLQAPLLELREVLTETHWRELGEKVSGWFHKVFNSEGLKGETLGKTIGKTLGAAINAAIDFLLGLNIYQIVLDLGLFFEDIFVGAVGEIKWIKVLEVLVEGIGGIFEALHTLVTIWVNELVVAAMEGLNELTGIELIPQEAIDDAKTKIEAMKEGIYTATEVAKGAADIWAEKMREIGDGTQYSRDQLIRWQEAGGLTNEQIEKMIEAMQEYADKNHLVFDEAKLGLEGYAGDWQTFRDTVLGVIDETDEKMKGSKQTIEDLGNTSDLLAEKSKNAGKVIKDEADTTEQKLDHTAAIGKDHLGILDNALKTSDENVKKYSDSAVEALSDVDAKTGEIKVDFEGMTEAVNTTLEELTTSISTWYENIALNYFSYDMWNLMLQEGPLLALTNFFIGDGGFLTTWDNQMQEWWENHVKKPWFTDEKWEQDIYKPWETYRDTKWKAFLKWWDDTMKKWWTDKVIPWFKEEKWKEQFDNIKKAADTSGDEVQKLVTKYANDTADAIGDACRRAIEYIEEVISKLEEALNLAEQLPSGSGGHGHGDGSGTGSGSGGGSYSGGGGGHEVPFMPRLEIMHFEDNLGMSAFRFPELATGAVIPPNNEFLALLGDQKSGTNIETPLDTMLEAFRSVMDEYLNPAFRSATMEVDGETFARLMMPHMMDEANRLGYNTEIIEGI